jgi:hypothetical protein
LGRLGMILPLPLPLPLPMPPASRFCRCGGIAAALLGRGGWHGGAVRVISAHD